MRYLIDQMILQRFARCHTLIIPTSLSFSRPTCARPPGSNAATLKNWISREPPAIHLSENDRRALGSGRPHLFTFRRVLLAAICAELVALGLPPRRAGSLAGNFTDFGEGGRQGDNVKRRGPGEMFPTGSTVIVACPQPSKDKPEMWVGRVINLTPDTPLRPLFSERGLSPVAGLIVVDVSAINRRVREALGLPTARAA